MKEKKQMNKKALLGVIALVAVVALMGVLYGVYREKPVEGSKEIIIEVVNKAQECIVWDALLHRQRAWKKRQWFMVLMLTFWWTNLTKTTQNNKKNEQMLIFLLIFLK